MDKGEGLEQKSNDWESAKRKYIDLGAYKKILRKAMRKKKKKNKERRRRRRRRRRRSWDCLHLKISQR